MKSSILISVIAFCVQSTCNKLFHDSEPNWKEGAVYNSKFGANLIARYNTDVHIVGGHPVEIENYPWIVSIMLRGGLDYTHICGGSIISPNRVLSAAHCSKYPPKEYKVCAGLSNTRKCGRDMSEVHEIIVHPMYSSTTLANDISIFLLESALEMSSRVAVINLPKEDEPIADGSILQVAGWGDVREGLNMGSTTLRAVSLPSIGNALCQKMLKLPITKSMLCAGFAAGEKDACQGDSGGPLTNKNTLVGLVSFGIGCARRNKPGVYTRVASYIKWIQSHM